MPSNRVFALIGSSVIALLQHFQLASFYRHAMKRTQGNWESEPRDVFANLGDLALRFYGDTFMGFYYTALVISIGSALFYVLIHEWIHRANLKVNFLTPLAMFWEYIVFGFGFVPMVANLAEITYCDESEDLERHSSLHCFKHKQITLMVFGFIGISSALFMAGGVFPSLKNERKSVERNAIEDTMFAGLYHLLIVSVIVMIAPMQRPWVGIFVHLLSIVYLVIHEGYAELHVASLRMAILFAQMWVFCATLETQDSDSQGSNMLYAWPVFMIIGYGVMPLKRILLQKIRKP
mmetsp:Transcript_19604/g.36031  ORF Transcript_19604/g.36031 Transcript_19604/m.36031 type:complete len:292 (+) Transcript_19604:1605-2480(+)